MAAAVEDSAWINHHAGRMNFPRHDALDLDFDAALGKDDAVEASGDHHAVALDLPLDLGTFAENYRLLGDDVALQVAVNSKRAGDGKCTFKTNALVDESCPLFTDATFCRLRPFPCHEIPQTMSLPL